MVLLYDRYAAFPVTPPQQQLLAHILRRDVALLERAGLRDYSLVAGFYEAASEKLLAAKGGRFPVGTTTPAHMPLVCRCSSRSSSTGKSDGSSKVLRAYYFAIALFMGPTVGPGAGGGGGGDDSSSSFAAGHPIPQDKALAAAVAAAAAAKSKKANNKPLLGTKPGKKKGEETPPTSNDSNGTYGQRFLSLVMSHVTDAALHQEHPLALSFPTSGNSDLSGGAVLINPYGPSGAAPTPIATGGGSDSRSSSSSMGVYAPSGDSPDMELHFKSSVWYYNSSIKKLEDHWGHLMLQDLGINAHYRAQVGTTRVWVC